ncbi:MAG: hypothetical protein EA373_09315 [Oceanospirillales bacterium]|jgi:hypothetical protein|nr:MAG: hypothetical protein EA373_09315 [Oceanospirillales bacterium]
MTRMKKQRRTVEMVILEKTPKKKERLTDPDSYESRKQAAMKKRKKQLSVYEKARLEEEQEAKNAAAGKRGERKLGPLAEKIRRINAKKKKSEQATEE